MNFDLERDINWELVWEWGFKILAALAILLITHFIAKGVKWAIAKMVDRVPALQKHSTAEPGETVREVAEAQPSPLSVDGRGPFGTFQHQSCPSAVGWSRRSIARSP